MVESSKYPYWSLGIWSFSGPSEKRNRATSSCPESVDRVALAFRQRAYSVGVAVVLPPRGDSATVAPTSVAPTWDLTCRLTTKAAQAAVARPAANEASVPGSGTARRVFGCWASSGTPTVDRARHRATRVAGASPKSIHPYRKPVSEAFSNRSPRAEEPPFSAAAEEKHAQTAFCRPARAVCNVFVTSANFFALKAVQSVVLTMYMSNIERDPAGV